MTIQYYACHSCAVAIINDDYSEIDDEQTESRIETMLSVSGPLVHVKPEFIPGFDCEFCDAYLGDNDYTYVFETIGKD